MLSKKDLKLRKPVWSSLSQLWLDTELEEGDLNRIAKAMFESGYSIEVLRGIYEIEVAPIVYTNLLSPAGEWAGFDDEWLHEKIISSLNSKKHCVGFFMMFKRRLMFYATETHWKTLIIRVNEMKHKDQD